MKHIFYALLELPLILVLCYKWLSERSNFVAEIDSQMKKYGKLYGKSGYMVRANEGKQFFFISRLPIHFEKSFHRFHYGSDS